MGFARLRLGGAEHAGLWSGSAASWIDLNPAGSTDSEAYAVDQGQQVGRSIIGGVNTASLLGGSAGSWVDLSAFLPAGFSYSSARSVWHDAGTTYIVGYGFNDTTLRNEALMWVSTVPEPSSSVVLMVMLLAFAICRRRFWLSRWMKDEEIAKANSGYPR